MEFNTEIILVGIGTILAVMGTGATVIGVTYSFLSNFKTDINAHIDRLDEEQKEAREEQRLSRMRTDHLYEILCSLLKEKRN